MGGRLSIHAVVYPSNWFYIDIDIESHFNIFMETLENLTNVICQLLLVVLALGKKSYFCSHESIV